MRMRARVREIVLAGALLCLLLAVGCGGEETGGTGAPEPEAEVRAFVTIPPQAQFVERVGGDHVQVGTLVKPGHSPHTYEPTPRQMTELAEAGVYFLIGVPFEDILKDRIRSANPDMAMVDTGRGIELRDMETHHAHGEEEKHEHEDEHEQEGRKDPHVWLDPANVRVMAGHIAEALIEQDPEHEADYRANLEEFRAELDRLDARIRESLEGVEQREILVFHPAFGYFTDAYGLEQVPIEIEGKEPGAKALSELISFAKERGIKVVFVQKQFSSKTAQVVAREIDGQVVPLDPLARDYVGTMEDIAEAFAEALR